ncbi:helix-turn-helix transcriptional regulator [Leucobacter denitrificans]|uniref:WYL domain-containing protein n=1 Tax=Leucobacter denitrificans TaxID=683042 RepID=A0A7G9S5X4_9MICO|nr:WYL domain-containing protein [Leucobacter denitrificans]QNN63249.1 WYL domain-containing protein [Leucobacter denitrificans]
MRKSLSANERVILLLSLVPYLREHGPTQLQELAETFDVDERVLRKLITFLGTAGIPGETLAYQHDDLFDIDWQAFESQGIVSLTHTVAVDETPRFTGAETAALLAGLHALKPILSTDDARLAKSLAKRLAQAMELSEVPTVSVQSGEYDAMLQKLTSAIENSLTVRFAYRDAEGVETSRTVQPSTLVEREGTWYLRGFAQERDAERTFRVSQISDLETLDEFVPIHNASDGTSREGEEIHAYVPERLLPSIRGFAPEVVKDPLTPPGHVRVRFEAWHSGAAVRLVQHGVGAIEILSPPSAREAAREWVLRALEANAGNGKTPDQNR